MTYEEWINKVIESGNLCGEYQGKVSDANSKLSLMRILLDANGVSYLPEMNKIGLGLPYEILKKDFGKYINGNYLAEYGNEKGNGYSSAIYCDYHECVVIESTLTTMLCCDCDVYVKENDFVKIYADSNCKLCVHCPKSSRCIVEYWDGAEINIDGDDIQLKKN